MSFSYATVIETNRLNSRLIRVTLKIDDLVALDVQPAGDSAVGVYFRVTDTESGPEPDGAGRNYSIRHQRGDTVDLDIVLHEHGLATSWAQQTCPGACVGLDHARSWYRPDPQARWQLLVTDLSGLPATARILEELDPAAHVTVVAEVAEPADLDYLPSHRGLTLIPTVGTGNGLAPSQLAALVAGLTLPPGRGYCWFAGEAAESRTVRKYLRRRGFDRDQYDITGYWRFDSETWDVRFAAIEDDVLPVYERALAEGKGDKVAFEEFEDALERAGL